MPNDISFLLVEDKQDQMDFEIRRLKELGYTSIISVNSGIKALEYLAQNTNNLPSLVLMDTTMPDGLNDIVNVDAGIETCKKIREVYPQSFGIIGMSSDYKIEKEWISAGADAFLNKTAVHGQYSSPFVWEALYSDVPDPLKEAIEATLAKYTNTP